MCCQLKHSLYAMPCRSADSRGTSTFCLKKDTSTLELGNLPLADLLGWFAKPLETRSFYHGNQTGVIGSEV
jgi:hypothetical protein